MNRRVIEVMAWRPEVPGWDPAGPGEASWQDAALCAQADPDAWFPERGESVVQPKAVCRRCPVRAQCLEYALEVRAPFGIWGGLTERQRRPLLAARGRNREGTAA